MEKLSLVYVDFSSSEKIYSRYPELVSEERNKKISRIKPEKDKILSFFAEIGIRRELSEYAGISYKDIRFSYNAYGKPYLSGSDINFSLSHSGNIIAFAVSEKPVGVDVEYIKSPRLRVAERFFTPNEYDYIIKSENPELEFYKIWTSKESYLKMLGTGLSKSLKSFDVLSDELKNYFFTRQCENYMLTLCYENAVNMDYKIHVTDSVNLLKAVEQFQE